MRESASAATEIAKSGLTGSGYFRGVWRRGPGSNRRIKVLQTSPLPLGYRAPGWPPQPGVKAGGRSKLLAAQFFSRSCLERETRFELATLALARRCSTTELLPLPCRFPPIAAGHKPHSISRKTLQGKIEYTVRPPLGQTPKRISETSFCLLSYNQFHAYRIDSRPLRPRGRGCGGSRRRLTAPTHPIQAHPRESGTRFWPSSLVPSP